MIRVDGRAPNELRKIDFKCGVVKNASSSVLAACGLTEVICTVSIEAGVPSWMKAQKVAGGWLTAEYAMLPGSTHTRNKRENKTGPSGRSSEIQRLIGRALRSVVNLEDLGENTVYVDCDVLNADGGTRCTSINGASVALMLAFADMQRKGLIEKNPMTQKVAAISVGIHHGTPILDLCYAEDSKAEVDMNVVMSCDGKLIEVQGTAEGKTFSRSEMNLLLDLAEKGTTEIFQEQRKIFKF